MRGSWMRAVVPALAMLLVPVACAAEKAAKDDKPAQTEGSVVATVGGARITLQELDEYLRKTNSKAFQDFFDARRAALDGLIADRLLTKEASSRGVTVDKLKADITAGGAVTDEDVSKFYTENQARMGGRTLDQIKDQIKSYLAGQKQQQAMADFIKTQRDKAGVTIALEPPRADVKVAENDPVRGSKGAPVQIVEFSDFQ